MKEIKETETTVKYINKDNPLVIIKTESGDEIKFFPSEYTYFPSEGIEEGDEIRLVYYINQAIYFESDPIYLLRYFVFKGLPFTINIDTGNYGLHQTLFSKLSDYKKGIYKEVKLFNGYLKFKN